MPSNTAQAAMDLSEPDFRVQVLARWRAVVVLASLSLLLGVVLSRTVVSEPVALAPATRVAAVPRLGLSSLPLAARGPISTTLGRGVSAFRISSSNGGFVASSSPQRLSMRFGRSGVLVASGSGRVGLSLRAVGYGSSVFGLGAVMPRVRANRAVYARSGLSEWYANGPLGLEQGFTVSRAPTRGQEGALTLAMAVSGDLRASLSRGAQGISLGRAGGGSLRYDELMAVDARGRRLPSWFALDGNRVLLRVDVRGARFPLRIDPLVHQAKLTDSEEVGEGKFGDSVALSSAGNTAVVGAAAENESRGSVSVFTRSGTTWTQQAKLTGTEKGEALGNRVALSADGNTAAFSVTGAVVVYTRSEGKWALQQRITGTEESEVGKALFGSAVALSGDGNTVLVGGANDSNEVGSVWVYARSEGKWSQQGTKFTGTGAIGREGTNKEIFFGWSVALSNEGNTALVGAYGDNGFHGAAWVFTRSEGKWTQQGSKLTGGEEVNSPNPGRFGYSVALSADGSTALMGGYADHKFIGAAWVFTRTFSTWSQQGSKIVASGERGSNEFPNEGWFGRSVALSPDGNSALIGGIADELISGGYETSGAAVEFTRSEASWSQQSQKITSGEREPAFGYFGDSVALSNKGRIGLVGAEGTTKNAGAAWVLAPGFAPEEIYGLENELEPDLNRPCAGDPVNCATGNKTETQTDLNVGGRGPGLHLTRTYNSQLAATETSPGPFGFGWTGAYSAHLAINEEEETATVYQDNGSSAKFELTPGKTTYVPIGGWIEGSLFKEGSTYVCALPDQTKLTFNSAGLLTSETDRNGNTITVSHNTEGRLESVADGAGRKLTFAYNGEGFVESVKDPMGHTVKYTYEASNLSSVTQPGEAGLRWQFKYNSEHEMTSETDGRGHAVTTEYDGSHRVISQTDAMERKRTWKYTTTEWGEAETTIAEPTGAVTVEQFNSAMLPMLVTHAYGTASAASTTYEYNEANELVGLTDPNGHTTTYAYNTSGDRLSAKDANGNETKWSYNGTHDIEKITTPKGETTTIKRDTHGNPEVIERPAPGSKTQKTSYKYNSSGDITSETNPLERTRTFEYDSAGDRTVETDAEGDKLTRGYNEDSQETSWVSPKGNVKGVEASKYETKLELDSKGRKIKVTDPLGHTTKYAYDGDGNLEAVTDGNGHKTTYTYDADNERTVVKAPNGNEAETEYDKAGQVASQTDGNKHTTKYERNPLEQVTEVINPLGRKTLKEYDLVGNLKKLTDPEKRTTSYTYDPGSRFKEVTYSDGKTHSVKYEYDKDGDRTKMIDGTGTTTYTFDQLDRLTESKDGHGDTTKYEYNLANQPLKITYPNAKAVTRAYDKAGRLEKVTDWLSNATKFSYDPNSNLTATTFPTATGDEDKYAYNEANQMSEVKMAKGAETLASIVYTRDTDGQVKATTTKGLPGEESAENTYDENSRLTKAGSTAYEYDAANNATKIGANTYSYDTADELEKGTGSTFAYDELGERTKITPSGAATAFGYNQAGDLISVERPEEGKTPKIEDTYAYDGNGLRASQTITGKTSYLAWELAERVPLLLNDGTNSYIYGPGNMPIEQINSEGKPLYMHHDQQGSIRMLTGTSGKSEATMTYDAYGNTSGTTGTATTPLGYDGQYTSSDTGLIYLRARVYDPKTAQFLTIDPLSSLTRQPYDYANDNPVNEADPTGTIAALQPSQHCETQAEREEHLRRLREQNERENRLEQEKVEWEEYESGVKERAGQLTEACVYGGGVTGLGGAAVGGPVAGGVAAVGGCVAGEGAEAIKILKERVEEAERLL